MEQEQGYCVVINILKDLEQQHTIVSSASLEKVLPSFRFPFTLAYNYNRSIQKQREALKNTFKPA